MSFILRGLRIVPLILGVKILNSSGRRMCLGITMASIVVMVTLANLLYRFDWKLPNGMKREDESVEEGVGLNIYRKLPLYLVPIIYEFEKSLEQ